MCWQSGGRREAFSKMGQEVWRRDSEHRAPVRNKFWIEMRGVDSCHNRKGPENLFPTAHNDIYDAVKWVLASPPAPSRHPTNHYRQQKITHPLVPTHLKDSFLAECESPQSVHRVNADEQFLRRDNNGSNLPPLARRRSHPASYGTLPLCSLTMCDLRPPREIQAS